MPRRREIAHSPLGDSSVAEHNNPLDEAAHGKYVSYDTVVQALMSTPPHVAVPTAREELLPLRDVLADALETLSPRERYVFERLVIERVSLAKLGKDMSISKSHIHRLKGQAAEKLRAHLEDDWRILEHLKR